MKRIFVSHPLTSNFVGNRAKAEHICREIAKQGLLPISPLHLFSFYDSEDHAIRDAVLRVCFRLIDMCDEVWVYGNSEGCQLEVAYAKQTCKIVRQWERIEEDHHAS